MFERFPPTSRYYQIETSTLETEDGRQIVFLKRRFLPDAERFALVKIHVVIDGERPDTLAAEHVGDPQQFWRLCDANNVLAPEELTAEIGRQVRITLPEGVEAARSD
jgi:hypothetical protein